MKLIDLTGQTFGRLTVVSREESTNKNAKWTCLCECGKTTAVFGIDLKRGKTKSCGCIHSEQLAQRNYKHGKSKTRLSNIWRGLKERCYNSSCKAYHNYGERGIIVCDEWLYDFQAFYDWSIRNGYSDNLSIDRIDVNGNYEPSNCRWADYKQQANNTRTNHYITYSGETHTMKEWSEILKIDYNKLNMRIYRGWTIEKALSTP